MEALVKVVSQLHKQWGIDCKPKDFTLAVARLLQIGVIDQPVDILHPEVWEKCTKALAEETMSSGRGKNLKSWGKVVHALQKAIQEQETWRAAKSCLLATPKLGVGAATQTLLPPDAGDSAEPKDLQEGDTSPQPPNPDPLTEGQKRAKSFWGALAEEARSTAEKSESKETWTTPPPYAPQDGAEHKEEGRGENASGGNREEALKSASAHKQEGEENEEEKSSGDERGEKGGVNEGRKPNQSGYRKKCPHRANTLSVRRRGGSRWRERPTHKGKGRGRSPTKRYRNPEVTSQSRSDSGSDTSWDEWLTTDSNLEEKETKINRVKGQNIPIQIKKEPGGGEIPLTDWRKIKTACADWAPSATLAFPVRVTDGGQRVHSPINPKDIQTIVKAIADKGLNSALVSTLIDGIFGGDDMLPFDIKQTCRLIFDGAGMIVFKQEWEDNCTRQLARVTGADHPLHGSSLQWLMGTDPTMITPHAQAQGLRAHEVMTTTRAAREAIRVASRVVAKPSPWSTIKQNESESFTQFVDRLQAAIDSSTLPVEAKGPVLADCLRQQCNSKAKEILRSLPAGSTIADMIKRVANEEHLAPIQAAVRTAIANMMDRITGRPRNPYTPVTKEDDKLTSTPSEPGNSALGETKQRRNSPRRGGPRCLCVILILELVTIEQSRENSWLLGKMWGIRYTEPGTDRGGLIIIKKEVVPNDPWPVGPNQAIAKRVVRAIRSQDYMIRKTNNQKTSTTPPTTEIPYGNPLWKMMQASYQVLNKTNPNLTEHCWLCYGRKPPFYEAVGITDMPLQSNGINPAQCIWDTEKQTITLTQVVGSGMCVGKVPEHNKQLCIGKARYKTPAKWLIPAENAKWICSTVGLTPCLSLEIFDESSEYCVQASIVPKIFYHPEEYAYDSYITPEHHLLKREPFTVLTIATLMIIGGAGLGTGVTSLVQQSKEFSALRVAVDEDMARIEQSITALEQSIRSLSEVVLQNRRGLDLVFLQQGGVCAALREECCVYADHTGVVRDTMAKLREGLEKQKREREAQQDWFASWFNHPPWLTTLISTLIGPIAMIMMALIFGPCLLNRIMSFVRSRLESVNIMLVERQQLL
ncbi:MLV-related proviral Env polyprotein-like [Grus japonensis]|uniref:MLV-related proviral Env polyprotein-like n=1 Tax=Grus japonensis TaxID=30415 RepID=A0ABC9VZM7_GRUJA